MPQFVLFETGGIQFGLDRRSISGIEPISDAAGAVKNPDSGNRTGSGGQYCDPIDLSKALKGCVASSPARHAEVILLNGNTGHSLLADKVGETLEVGAEDLYDLPPVFNGKARACFQKVLRMEDTMALVIDVKGLETVFPIMHHAQQKHGDGKKIHPDKPAQGAPPLSSRGDHLEAVMMKKLSHMIGQHVDQVVSRTIADVIERHRTNTK